MHRTLVALVFLVMLGAGPCDYDTAEETGETGDMSADCPEDACLDMVTVEVIRADNTGFFTGTYEFAALLPDGSEYGIGCDLAYLDEGLVCAMGDLSVMNAQLDAGGQTIWLRLLGAPESVELSVSYNGFEIGRRALAPAYEEIFANGDECPATCYQADASMAVESW